MGFSRQEHWSRLPCPSPRDLPSPKDRTYVSCIAGRFFTHWEAPIQTYTDPQINTSTHNQQPTESPVLPCSCRGLTVPHSRCSVKAFKIIMMHGSYPLLTGQLAAEKVVHEWSSKDSWLRAKSHEATSWKQSRHEKGRQRTREPKWHILVAETRNIPCAQRELAAPESKELPRFSFYLLLPSRTERFLHPKWDSGWPWWFCIGSKPPPATAHHSLTILHPERTRHEDS